MVGWGPLITVQSCDGGNVLTIQRSTVASHFEPARFLAMSVFNSSVLLLTGVTTKGREELKRALPNLRIIP